MLISRISFSNEIKSFICTACLSKGDIRLSCTYVDQKCKKILELIGLCQKKNKKQ